jgi:hypothetical protein
MSRDTTLYTIQDLVDYVLARPNDNQRYKLSLSDRNVWVDAEEGAAYEALESPKYVSEYRDDGQPDWELRRAIYEQEQEVYRAQRPAEVRVEFGFLKECGYSSTWHTYGVHLDPELTQQVKAVWTMKPYYENSTWMKPSGTITLKTLLKRLGAGNGIDNQINAAIAEQKERERLAHRRHVRQNVAKKAAELMALIESNPDIIFPAQLSELAGLDVEA